MRRCRVYASGFGRLTMVSKIKPVTGQMRSSRFYCSGFGSLTDTGLGPEGLKDCTGKCGTKLPLVPVSAA
jgi:hypothetical protein